MCCTTRYEFLVVDRSVIKRTCQKIFIGTFDVNKRSARHDLPFYFSLHDVIFGYHKYGNSKI